MLLGERTRLLTSLLATLIGVSPHYPRRGLCGVALLASLLASLISASPRYPRGVVLYVLALAVASASAAWRSLARDIFVGLRLGVDAALVLRKITTTTTST